MSRIVTQKMVLNDRRWRMTQMTEPMDPGAFGPAYAGQLDQTAAANQRATNARAAEMRAHMAGQRPAVKPGAGVAFAGSVPSVTPTGA